MQTLSDDYFASRNKYFLLLTAFTVVVAIVAALTIYLAVSVITGSRVRETKLVRAIGGSSIGIMAAAVVEATVLGLLGAALGLPLGVALAGTAPAVTGELGIRVPLDNVGLPATWLAAIGAGALAVTVLSALPAALLSARRSAVESAKASGSRALQAGHVLVAIVFAGAAFAMRGGGMIRAVASAGLATLSAAALSVIIPLLLRVHVSLPRLGLALGYASRQWSRSASVIGIVTAAVALVAAVPTGFEQLRSHFVDAASKQGLVDATVTSLTGDIDPALADTVDAAPRPTVMLRMDGAPVQDPAVLDGVRAAAAADLPVTMTESFSLRADIVAMVERLLSITRMMSLVALVIALVGIANTVFLSWRERRRDRALLNTLGLTPLGSAGVMAVELLLLALPAAGAGSLVGEWAGGFIAGVAVG